MLYQFLSTIRSQDGTPLMDSRGRITSHLTGLLYRTTNFMQQGIKPVFVFDGKPHELKSKTLAERKKIRTEAGKKFEEALKEGRKEDARKFAQQSVKLTGEMVEDAKKLIGLMGLPIVQAPSEGEAQIARMAHKGDLQGCVSQDYDALLFGTPVLLRNIAITGKRKAPGKNYYYDVVPEKIELAKNLRALDITREKLVWIAILVGTDFNEKFPRIGAKTALQLVKKHNSFEEIIKETKHEPGFDYKEIEEIFLKPEFNENYEIKFSQPQREKIIEFLCGEHDFSRERVESALGKLAEKLEEKGEQSRLGQWFK
jgi:flap endonuclease-1